MNMDAPRDRIWCLHTKIPLYFLDSEFLLRVFLLLNWQVSFLTPRGAFTKADNPHTQMHNNPTWESKPS